MKYGNYYRGDCKRILSTCKLSYKLLYSVVKRLVFLNHVRVTKMMWGHSRQSSLVFTEIKTYWTGNKIDRNNRQAWNIVY